MRKNSIILLVILVLSSNLATAQKSVGLSGTKETIDSLVSRIDILKNKLAQLKESRDPSLYYVKKEYDHTIFSKQYEELYVSEDLDKAKEIIEQRLEKATLRKDKVSISFYNDYKDRVNRDIKMQKIHYQTLFKKEKNFKKQFFNLVKEENMTAYSKASRMTELALKYAKENKLENTVEYLSHYKQYIDAVIFDHKSEYDLKKLTRNENDFEDVFVPLLSSDSIHQIKEAGNLVKYCYDYAASTKSIIDTNYFAKQQKTVKTAISDYFDKQHDDLELAQITDQAIIGRSDTINPAGVYKWQDRIVVIGYFTPQSGFENVRRGEAIITADKLLAKYVKENDIGRIKSGEKFGYTFLLPFQQEESVTDFLYDREKEKWQYMVCYTKVVSTYFTREISKYMPPIKFSDEATANQNSNEPDTMELTDAN